MRLLWIAIALYVAGLLTFYIFAVFGERAWDIAYFGWAKAFDCGVIFWAVIFYGSNYVVRKRVLWLYIFSIIRFIGDIQSFFTGIGVNNEKVVAFLFLSLLSIAAYLSFLPDTKVGKIVSKKLLKPDEYVQ